MATGLLVRTSRSPASRMRSSWRWPSTSCGQAAATRSSSSSSAAVRNSAIRRCHSALNSSSRTRSGPSSATTPAASSAWRISAGSRSAPSESGGASASTSGSPGGSGWSKSIPSASTSRGANQGVPGTTYPRSATRETPAPSVSAPASLCLVPANAAARTTRARLRSVQGRHRFSPVYAGRRIDSRSVEGVMRAVRVSVSARRTSNGTPSGTRPCRPPVRRRLAA